MTGWISQFDAFPKVDGVYRKRTLSGGLLSVAVAAVMVYMLWCEAVEYLTYRQTHQFIIDATVQRDVQINVDMTVAMPCALLRVDVLDVSGDSKAVRSSLRTLTITRSQGFKHHSLERSINHVGDRHVHDIIREAERRAPRKDLGGEALELGHMADLACHIDGSVLVSKVAGLFHVTAHGHGHGGAYVPQRMLNFTHRIDELSFGPLYPSLVNPLDNTLHVVRDSNAAISYFVSVISTTYISPASHRLSTNQYAVNEFRKSYGPHSQDGSGVPGIFLEYSFEPIAVEVREHRISFPVFLIRLCAATTGLFVTAGVVHLVFSRIAAMVRSPHRSGVPAGIIDVQAPKG
ncbi:hypothetical protein GGI26_002993 [Coemansia sp. RSA 1358]|uniref:DUF1692-domain-containing protein n=1 Tax=Coemansia umbellata TaxID=1424467 RepID=A0ABQ8PQK7_9FUNG|nr:endoplasmic reticulum vesicle transporter-domain-containing protein [Coemansia spiralis]KAJ1993959.1 hypothetical protein EDC05_001870 [Coemansia umbellata]KAJ2622724.1 hypothetical protein GGI26_002993 [Coemansia sp. RSA 1358]